MTKLRASGALRREAAGEGADFVAAADVDHRALEDRVYREAVDHGLDLAIVERAAIARKEIVDRCAIFEVAFAHPRLPWSAFPSPVALRGSYRLCGPSPSPAADPVPAPVLSMRSPLSSTPPSARDAVSQP